MEISYQGENPYLSKEEVTQFLDESGIAIIGEKLRDLPLEEINKQLCKNHYIKEIESTGFAGTHLVIKIKLHHFLMHIFTETNEQYYIAEDGFIVPYHPNIKENIIIANGYIPEISDGDTTINSNVLKILYRIASTIKNNPFDAAQFKQLYVNKNQEIELLPSLGEHIVLFGTDDNTEEKLLYLRKIYTETSFYSGPEPYKQLDVRFKNMIIAKRRNQITT